MRWVVAGPGWAHAVPRHRQSGKLVAACEAPCKQKGVAPDQLHLCLDYLAIPQKNMSLRLCAIDSLGVFSSICENFIVIAPSTVHKDTKKICDKASYARRGWR